MTNINECVNLRNIYDLQTSYLVENEITELHNVKRIYSDSNKNEKNRVNFLRNSFKHNKLEYINVSDNNNKAPPILL